LCFVAGFCFGLFHRRFVYRAGWKERGRPIRERFGRWWVWIGPYVVGPDVRSF
jgi:hypothetical protein